MRKIKYQNRDPKLETSGKIVGCYEREFYCFSNFSSFSVKWRGKLWQTSEHAYQSAYFFVTAPKLAKKIAQACSAHEAFVLAKKNADKAPKDWEEKKDAIMEDILRHKLRQNPYVKHKLLQTGNRKIVEDSPKDAYWGWGPKRNGRNQLGKIWMKLRKELR